MGWASLVRELIFKLFHPCFGFSLIACFYTGTVGVVDCELAGPPEILDMGLLKKRLALACKSMGRILTLADGRE